MSIPLFVRKLNAAESKALQAALKSNDGRVVRRAQIVRLSAQGRKVQAIAPLLGVSVACASNTLKGFNRDGLAVLKDKHRSGRPPKAGADYIACLRDAVARSPRDFGYVFSCWTLARLREHVGRRCKVWMSPQQLSRILKKNGIVYRRPRHVMAHLRDQDDYDEKKEVLAFLKKKRSNPAPVSNCSTSMSVRFISTRP